MVLRSKTLVLVVVMVPALAVAGLSPQPPSEAVRKLPMKRENTGCPDAPSPHRLRGLLIGVSNPGGDYHALAGSNEDMALIAGALERLTSTTQCGDTVLLHVSGYAMPDQLVLAGQQTLPPSQLRHPVTALRSRGAFVVFSADVCNAAVFTVASPGEGSWVWHPRSEEEDDELLAGAAGFAAFCGADWAQTSQESRDSQGRAVRPTLLLPGLGFRPARLSTPRFTLRPLDLEWWSAAGLSGDYRTGLSPAGKVQHGSASSVARASAGSEPS